MWTFTRYQIAWSVCSGIFPRRNLAHEIGIDRRLSFFPSDKPTSRKLLFLYQLQWSTSTALPANFHEKPIQPIGNGDGDEPFVGISS